MGKLTFMRCAMAAPLMCLSATAFAQEQQAAQRGQLESVTVMARKQAESIQTTPVAITALSADALQDQRVVNISDIQTQTPSLSIAPASSDPLSSVVSIRGQVQNDTLLSLQPSVGIYFDGVYYGQTTGLALSTLVDVERVEVLKGPQGTLYGKNTTGGALTVYTALPTNEFEGLLRGGYGNYDSREVAAMINVPIVEDKAAMRLVGSYMGSDGFGYNVHSDKRLEASDNVVLRGALKLNPSDSLELIIRGDYSHGKNSGSRMKPAYFNPASAGTSQAVAEMFGVGSVADPVARAAAVAAFEDIIDQASDNKTFDFNTPVHSRGETYGASLTATWTLSDELELKSITAYRHLSREFLIDLDGSPFMIADGFGDTRAKQFTQELNLSGKAFDNRLNWIVGAFYYHLSGTEIGANQALVLLNPSSPNTADNEVVNKSIAVFAQATYSITDDFRITGGIRWTEDKSRLTTRSHDALNCQVPVIDRIGGNCLAIYNTSARDVSYTIGLDYTLWEDTMVYAKTSKGFKGGGFNQRGSASAGSFDAFAPETVTDYEVGLKSDMFDRRVRFNFATYLSEYKNIQRSILVVGPGGAPNTIVQNAASARIHGVEAALDVIPVEGLVLHATLGYTDPKYKKFVDGLGNDLSAQPFFLVPQWTYSLSATHTLDTGFGELNTTVSWHWQDATALSPASSRLLAAYTDQKAYGLLNAQISFRPSAVTDLDIAFWAKNITNKQYFNRSLDLSPSLGSILHYVGEPRTYGISIQKRF